MAITTKCVPIEAYWSIGLVERAYATLRRAFEIIYEDIGTTTSKEACLQMVVKAVNDSASPGGLIPTLLVYSAFPRMIEADPPALSIQ